MLVKVLPTLIFAWLAASVMAEPPAATPTPTPIPFAGFGKGALDRKKGKATPDPLAKPRATPTPAPVPDAGAHTGEGIALGNGWQGHTTEASGGQTMKLADLHAVLKDFGKAEADLAAHPDAIVYDGPAMDGAPGETCRIPYLMPLSQAEKLLFKSRGMTAAARAVAPGLPDGLVIHTYDVKDGIYHRLCIVTDSATPDPQVVSMVLKAEGVNYYPPKPYRKIEREWHVFDYVNTENRGQSDIHIDTRVWDARKDRHCIVINTTGRNGPLPDELPEPGILHKPAKHTPKETTTWYVPSPMIRLMLYCLANQMQH